ncbi:hypothetical protein BBU64B_I0025 (plasmid) [Borreliella burgdorferi 64b]|nr:hypothetical protein BBU64B_I0025 [Borreliella burgdorferi 64b]
MKLINKYQTIEPLRSKNCKNNYFNIKTNIIRDLLIIENFTINFRKVKSTLRDKFK